MTLPDADLELALLGAYREMIARYTHALRLSEQLQGALDRESPLRQIEELVREAAGIDSSILPLKVHWKDGGRSPGPAFGEALGELATLIEALAGRIRDAEQQAGAEKEHLAPALDAAARGSRMRQAYGRY